MSNAGTPEQDPRPVGEWDQQAEGELDSPADNARADDVTQRDEETDR